MLGPVKVPKRELKKSEIVELYNKNYDRLVECKYKHKELKKQLIEIEKQIQDIVETI